jgi:hypothetical protein
MAEGRGSRGPWAAPEPTEALQSLERPVGGTRAYRGLAEAYPLDGQNQFPQGAYPLGKN